MAPARDIIHSSKVVFSNTFFIHNVLIHLLFVLLASFYYNFINLFTSPEIVRTTRLITTVSYTVRQRAAITRPAD